MNMWVNAWKRARPLGHWKGGGGLHSPPFLQGEWNCLGMLRQSFSIVLLYKILKMTNIYEALTFEFIVDKVWFCLVWIDGLDEQTK